jgi:hypothetical protein
VCHWNLSALFSNVQLFHVCKFERPHLYIYIYMCVCCLGSLGTLLLVWFGWFGYICLTVRAMLHTLKVVKYFPDKVIWPPRMCVHKVYTHNDFRYIGEPIYGLDLCNVYTRLYYFAERLQINAASLRWTISGYCVSWGETTTRSCCFMEYTFIISELRQGCDGGGHVARVGRWWWKGTAEKERRWGFGRR